MNYQSPASASLRGRNHSPKPADPTCECLSLSLCFSLGFWPSLSLPTCLSPPPSVSHAHALSLCPCQLSLEPCPHFCPSSLPDCLPPLKNTRTPRYHHLQLVVHNPPYYPPERGRSCGRAKFRHILHANQQIGGRGLVPGRPGYAAGARPGSSSGHAPRPPHKRRKLLLRATA